MYKLQTYYPSQGATVYENQAAKPDFGNFENHKKIHRQSLRLDESFRNPYPDLKRQILRRYWTVLLQKKNFGSNVIYCFYTLSKKVNAGIIFKMMKIKS